MTQPTKTLRTLLVRMTYPITYVHEDDIEGPRGIAEGVLDGSAYNESPAEFREKISTLLESGIDMGFDENHSDAGVRGFFHKVLNLLDMPRPWPEFDIQRIPKIQPDIDDAPVIGRLEMTGDQVRSLLQRPFERSWRGGTEFTEANVREVLRLKLRTGERLALRAKPSAVEGTVEMLSPDPPAETIANFVAFTGIDVMPI